MRSGGATEIRWSLRIAVGVVKELAGRPPFAAFVNVVLGSVAVVCMVFCHRIRRARRNPGRDGQPVLSQGGFGLNLSPPVVRRRCGNEAQPIVRVGFVPLVLGIVAFAGHEAPHAFRARDDLFARDCHGRAVVTFVGTSQPYARMWVLLMPSTS